MNSSYLGTDCKLNVTQPDLIFDKCEMIQATDFTESCPVYDQSLCQNNSCLCDPMTLPISV